jgi:DNA-directed RNA polymerase subunit M/transcription elongation factor TFIIS
MVKFIYLSSKLNVFENNIVQTQEEIKNEQKAGELHKSIKQHLKSKGKTSSMDHFIFNDNTTNTQYILFGFIEPTKIINKINRHTITFDFVEHDFYGDCCIVITKNGSSSFSDFSDANISNYEQIIKSNELKLINNDNKPLNFTNIFQNASNEMTTINATNNKKNKKSITTTKLSTYAFNNSTNSIIKDATEDDDEDEDEDEDEDADEDEIFDNNSDDDDDVFNNSDDDDDDDDDDNSSYKDEDDEEEDVENEVNEVNDEEDKEDNKDNKEDNKEDKEDNKEDKKDKKNKTKLANKKINDVNTNAVADDIEIMRKKICNMFAQSTLKKCGETAIKDLEQGVYDYAIYYCKKNNIIHTIFNEKFIDIYIAKARSMYTNLKKKSYIKNNNLLERLQNDKQLLHNLPFMNHIEIFPENWKELLNEKHKYDKSLCSSKKGIVSDQFKCGRCKQRKCEYYEFQTRGADEPMTIFITCLNCEKQWKI